MIGKNTAFDPYFRMIGELNQHYLNFWREVAMIESPTDSKAGVCDCKGGAAAAFGFDASDAQQKTF